jgi:hypothetical protein
MPFTVKKLSPETKKEKSYFFGAPLKGHLHCRNFAAKTQASVRMVSVALALTNVCREKGSLLSFVNKFGQVACRRC